MPTRRRLGRLLATAVLSAITLGPAPNISTASPLPTIVRAGVVLPHQAQLRHMQTASATATAPSLLQYGGGPVVTGPPHVYLIFWGPGWGTAQRDSHGDLVFSGDRYNGAAKLQELFKGLGTGGERWSGVMTQYCEGVAVGATACPNTSPHVAYPTGGALESVLYDTRPVPVSPTADQVAAEAVYAATSFGNTTAAANRNAQYMVLSPTGSHPDNFGLGPNFCAWHSAVDPGSGPVSFTSLPYVMDAGARCGMGYLNGPNGTLDGYTLAAGHEYAETLTDPSPPTSGWHDPTVGTEGETADKCPPPLIAGGPATPVNVPLTTGTFVLPATWSNDTLSCETAHTILPIRTVVPDVRNDNIATASRLLSAVGLLTGNVTKVVDCNFLGIVRDQNPTGGLTVPTGTPVNLTIGTAPKPPQVCG